MTTKTIEQLRSGIEKAGTHHLATVERAFASAMASRPKTSAAGAGPGGKQLAPPTRSRRITGQAPPGREFPGWLHQRDPAVDAHNFLHIVPISPATARSRFMVRPVGATSSIAKPFPPSDALPIEHVVGRLAEKLPLMAEIRAQADQDVFANVGAGHSSRVSISGDTPVDPMDLRVQVEATVKSDPALTTVNADIVARSERFRHERARIFEQQVWKRQQADFALAAQRDSETRQR